MISGGSSTKSKYCDKKHKNIPKEKKYEYNEFQRRFNEGLKICDASYVSSFNDGYISCYMKCMLLPQIINKFTMPSLVFSELDSDGKNVEVSIKQLTCNSFLHILSITVILGDNMTYMVKAYKYTPYKGKREFLHETTHLDMDNLFSFLAQQINLYLLPF